LADFAVALHGLGVYFLLTVLAANGVHAQWPRPPARPLPQAVDPAGHRDEGADSPLPDAGWQIEMVDAPKTFRFLGVLCG
jgi:hypothetical protein